MGTKITNKHNLPDAIVKATMVDKHFTNGDISVTQLIDAPQIRHLKKNNIIYEDAMDRVWALMGTAIHHVIELSEIGMSDARKIVEAAAIIREHGRADVADYMLKICDEKFPNVVSDDVLLEANLTTEILGWTISGTIDKFVIPDKKITDYKNCSSWAYIYEESKKKWAAQQNIYAYLLREHGYEVDEVSITAIFRDWSAMKQKTNKDYPPHPIMEIPLKLATHDQVREYLEARVRIHQAADNGNVAQCTKKEMWSNPDLFKVRKEGMKKSVRNLTSLPMAERFVEEHKHKHQKPLYIETIPGEDSRCEKYCSVKDVCPQRKAKLDALAEKSSIDNFAQ